MEILHRKIFYCNSAERQKAFCRVGAYTTHIPPEGSKDLDPVAPLELTGEDFSAGTVFV